MKKILNRIIIFFTLAAAFFIPGKSKAAGKPTVTSRVNKIRNVLKQEAQKGTQVEFTGKGFSNESLKGWGNWGNWNNWNNWRDWNNWANWGNWGNWANY